jgi:hypothetical protein
MAFEQLRAEIAMLVQQMDNEPEDIHELHARIRSKLNEIKAMGMPLPDDLVALERRLDGEERRSSRREESGAEGTGSSPRRAGRRQSAKRAKRPATAARAAKKGRGSTAKKSKRPAAKAAKKGRGSTARKSKRPARTARKSRGSAAKKSQRTGRRRR